MDALLIAINAKYVHTNLAVRYLSRCAPNTGWLEFSINDQLTRITAEIYRSNAPLVIFSCYLWNIRMVLDICALLKQARPTLKLALGGPEVSYRSRAVLENNPFMDYVLCGEGEVYFADFLRAHSNGAAFPEGVARRTPSGIVDATAMPSVPDLSALPFPYHDTDDLRHRIPYYETSRGCPFACGFCLSSASAGVRYLPIERVKQELLWFIERDIPLVKLVDRTFNSDNCRAVQLIEWIKQHARTTTFHFEIKAETASEEFIQSLCTAPPGLFQLEIGVQSTHPPTLNAINRRYDFQKISHVVHRLRETQNIHLHLDLIAGLPHEDFSAFRTSFNDVYRLHPHDLQLGFLKQLHGARMSFRGIQCAPFPPYEVVCSDAMDYGELLTLKGVADVLERYYNSGCFCHTINRLVQTYYSNDPFALYLRLADYCQTHANPEYSRKTAYRLLLQFIARFHPADVQLPELLKLDYFLNNRDTPPFFGWSDVKAQAFAFLKNPENICACLPGQEGAKPTELYKHVRFARFAFDVTTGGAHPVTLMLNEAAQPHIGHMVYRIPNDNLEEESPAQAVFLS